MMFCSIKCKHESTTIIAIYVWVLTRLYIPEKLADISCAMDRVCQRVPVGDHCVVLKDCRALMFASSLMIHLNSYNVSQVS